MSKLSKIVAWIAILGAFALMGLFAYWLVYPYKTIEMKTPMPLENDITEVKVGEVVPYIVDYCKYTDAPAVTFKSLINTHVYSFPARESKAPNGCNKFVSNSVVIPDYAEEGEYIVRFITRYQVNPIRVIEKSFDSVPFNVVK
jgi:hypothetical protein